MIVVEIPKEISLEVEKDYYEYNASLDILSYLMKQDNINEDYLNEYFKKSEYYQIELEKIKEYVANQQYLPKDKKIKGYSFNFFNHTIEYEEEE